jgi:NAD(P)-dependent dehydrogenase (short-subunit alcohol dehydrogenase family)
VTDEVRYLVFVSGGSSGIGAALARAVPWKGSRVLNLSRRAASGLEQLTLDLAEPAGWDAAARAFAQEMAGFGGERVVFFHSAGTLTPIGYAGEVDSLAYRRNVLLNSAAPQILGDAFLRAAQKTGACCDLVFISSGAAHNIYEGWTSYSAGKAAVDQWTRTAGAEQARRGGRCRVLAVAPGVVATAMQAEIRSSAPRDFPEVSRFLELEKFGALRAAEDAARDIWALLARGFENGAVLDLRTPETSSASS